MENKISPDFIKENPNMKEGTITSHSPESNKDERQQGNQNNSSISEEVVDNSDSEVNSESQDTNNQHEEMRNTKNAITEDCIRFLQILAMSGGINDVAMNRVFRKIEELKETQSD